MSYLEQDAIAGSSGMLARVAQCATGEGQADADAWASVNRREWAAAPGWDAAWASALASHPGGDYDPGRDESVITDGMILSQVQDMRAREVATPTETSP
jgi:hypothetical protein